MGILFEQESRMRAASKGSPSPSQTPRSASGSRRGTGRQRGAAGAEASKRSSRNQSPTLREGVWTARGTPARRSSSAKLLDEGCLPFVSLQYPLVPSTPNGGTKTPRRRNSVKSTGSSSSLMWRTTSSWKTPDRPLSRRSILSTDDFADDLGRRRCARRRQNELPVTAPSGDVLSLSSTNTILRLDSALQTLQVNAICRECCEVLGPDSCSDCLRCRRQATEEMRNERLIPPSLVTSADNYADAVTIQRSFPHIPASQLHDKMSRGEIARTTTLCRQLQLSRSNSQMLSSRQTSAGGTLNSERDSGLGSSRTLLQLTDTDSVSTLRYSSNQLTSSTGDATTSSTDVQSTSTLLQDDSINQSVSSLQKEAGTLNQSESVLLLDNDDRLVSSKSVTGVVPSKRDKSSGLFFVGMQDLVKKFSMGQFDEKGRPRVESEVKVKAEKTITERLRPRFVSTLRRAGAPEEDPVMMDDWYEPPQLPLRMHKDNPPT